MILTVTLNAAVDKTQIVPAFQLKHVNRPVRVLTMAGGKGINVARVLHALGEPVLTTGVLAGHAGALIEDCLTQEGIPHQFHHLHQGECRTCLAILHPETGTLTEIHEDGAHVAPEEFERFLARYASLLPHARWVVLSGSLPPGIEADAYRPLQVLALQAGIPVSIDTSGPALAHALAGRPNLVKPNQEEAESLLGFAITAESLPRALDTFLQLGAGTVALSLGAAGAAVANEREAFLLSAPSVPLCNPIGSGDSFLAALVAGMLNDLPLHQAASLAVAAGSANAAVPGTAACTKTQIHALLSRVRSMPLSEASAFFQTNLTRTP